MRAAILVLLCAALLAAAPPASAAAGSAQALPIQGQPSRLLLSPPLALAWPREGAAAVAVEGLGGLGASGPRTPAPIASVAKIMTAYLTLREHPLSPAQNGFTMTVTSAQVAEERRRVAEDQSVVPVQAGERLTERQALVALMLPSANNIAAMLAVHDAGSIHAFVARMNAEARALGMTSTTYTDPSGFESTTVSTPLDQIRLAEVAMRDETFATIVDRRQATLPVIGRVVNYNALAGHEGYVGVKTGSDEAAGGCLVFVKRIWVRGHRFIVLGAVLGQRGGNIIKAALASARRLGNSAAAALRATRSPLLARRPLLARSPLSAHDPLTGGAPAGAPRA